MIVTHERGSMKVVQEQGVEVVGSLHSVPYHQPPCGSRKLHQYQGDRSFILTELAY